MRSLFIIAAVICLSCIKAKNQTGNKIDVGKITPTDNFGNLMGTPDTTDWRFDDRWSSAETSLLNFEDTINTSGFTPANNLLAIAFPNPAESQLSLLFQSNQSVLIKFAVTDEDLNMISRSSLVLRRTPNNNQPVETVAMHLNLDDPAYKKGRNYRIYYGLYAEGKLLYKKGHGDFKKQ